MRVVTCLPANIHSSNQLSNEVDDFAKVFLFTNPLLGFLRHETLLHILLLDFDRRHRQQIKERRREEVEGELDGLSFPIVG